MDGLAWGAEGSLGAPFTVCGGALRLWGLWACVWEVMGPGWTPRQPARRPQRLVFGQSNPEGLGGRRLGAVLRLAPDLAGRSQPRGLVPGTCAFHRISRWFLH